MPFKKQLGKMLEQLPEAVGAVIVDWEGESVDQLTRGSDYEIRVLGAHKGIVLNRLRNALERLNGGQLQEVIVQYRNNKVLVVPLNDDYFLLLSIRSRELTARALVRIRQCAEQLQEEIC